MFLLKALFEIFEHVQKSFGSILYTRMLNQNYFGFGFSTFLYTQTQVDKIQLAFTLSFEQNIFIAEHLFTPESLNLCIFIHRICIFSKSNRKSKFIPNVEHLFPSNLLYLFSLFSFHFSL